MRIQHARLPYAKLLLNQRINKYKEPSAVCGRAAVLCAFCMQIISTPVSHPRMFPAVPTEKLKKQFFLRLPYIYIVSSVCPCPSCALKPLILFDHAMQKLDLLEREKHDLILDVQERVRAQKVNHHVPRVRLGRQTGIGRYGSLRVLRGATCADASGP